MNVAIFGGTFDPIHAGHVEVARAARREFFLDRVLFIPAGYPPHKPDRSGASYEHRLEMVRLAATDHPAFEASRIEEPVPDQWRDHYSIYTIRRVALRFSPHDRLFFVIGADAFGELTSWFHWRRVAALVEFIVVSRPGFKVEESAVPPGVRVHWLRSVHSPVSSSEVRQRVMKGQRLRGMLPVAVARYITRHKLYRPVRKRAAKAAPKRRPAPKQRPAAKRRPTPKRRPVDRRRSPRSSRTKRKV